MKTFRIRIALVLTCSIALSGCFGAATEEQLCERADECNFLPAGTSVDECTDQYTKCTEALTSSERADWENGTEACLKMQSCTNFSNCYDAVPGC
ncbi:MAG TPA: hypothetical protein VF794_29505 [Archangium sp.]|jgi:hypothetical protein|uniref:hypothetical protein n=1 Tax=Archangium sp. TaxID=1872627 RepID=UPI002EDB5258